MLPGYVCKFVIIRRMAVISACQACTTIFGSSKGHAEIMILDQFFWKSKGHAYIASVNHCIASRSYINHDAASVLSSKVNVQMVSHPFSCLRVMHKSSYYSSFHIHGSCWWHLQNHYTPFVHPKIMSESLVHPKIMPKSVYHIGSCEGHAKSTAFHLLSNPRVIVPKSVCHFGFLSCLNCCTRLLCHFS